MASSEDSSEKTYLPFGMRLVNFIGEAIRLVYRPPRLTSKRILSPAERLTGLHDFGSDDFREPLRLLCDELFESIRPHPFGNAALHRILQLHAENRLLLAAAWQRHPESLKQTMHRPLYVVGMPRTGTTLLYNLLCQDSKARPLMIWEALHPAVSARDEERGIDPRPKRTQKGVRFIHYIAPQLQQIHPMYADGPEECGWLMSNAFVSQMFYLNGSLPNYDAWFRSLSHERMLDVYEYYRQQLQLIQYRDLDFRDTDRHWVLKSPVHQSTLLPLMEAIPQANIIQTHRNPQDVIASCCSLFAATRGVLTSRIHPKHLGPEFSERLLYAVQQAQRAVEKYPERTTDVLYDQLVRDPIATVRGIYEKFGYEYSDEMESRMQNWLEQNPRGKFGKHAYRLEDYGLTKREVDAMFADYWSNLTASSAVE